jgi:hypothetical protein
MTNILVCVGTNSALWIIVVYWPALCLPGMRHRGDFYNMLHYPSARLLSGKRKRKNIQAADIKPVCAFAVALISANDFPPRVPGS